MKQPTKTTLTTSLSTLTIATLMAMNPLSVQANNTQVGRIGDLEIYEKAQAQKINLMMMLDTSGSMGLSSLVLPKTNKYGSPGDVDSALCSTGSSAVTYNSASTANQYVYKYDAIDRREGSATYGKPAFERSVTVDGQTVKYYLRGCGNPSIVGDTLVETDTGKFDRLSRLKEALIQLLASDKISNDIAVGLGNFSSKTPIKIGNTETKLVDGHSGTILVPVQPLTSEHRLKLIRAIATFQSVDSFTNGDGTDNPNLSLSSTNYPDIFKASSGTPTVHAYAEVGAYMMGTGTGRDANIEATTNLNILYDGAVVMQKNNSAERVYYICVELGTAADATQLGATVRQCANGWNFNEVNKHTGQTFGTWHDAANRNIGAGIPIYKPDDQGGWIRVTREELQRRVGPMTEAWHTHSKLPVGWRYAGWMKVESEPMDIEPVNTKGWNNPGGAIAFVSYRASPFIVTSTVQGAESCESGYRYQSTGWTNHAGQITSYKCRSEALIEAVKGTDGRVLRCPEWYTGCGSVQSRRVRNPSNGRIFTEYYIQGYHLKEATTSTSTQEYLNTIGGMKYAGADVSLKDGGRSYQEPENTKGECASNGIYFLTDGAPNSTTDSMAQTIINATLANKGISSKPTGGLASPALTSGLFSGETGGWEYIGEYARRLYNKDSNPAGTSIRTAVAGFGYSFNGLKKPDGTYDCEAAGATDDAKNACRWGKVGGGYGEGGFFYTQSAEDISNSLAEFLKRLGNALPASPAGTISIPEDPYQASGQQAIAFLPMVQPDVAGNKSIWAGNLKKYAIGTVDNAGKSESANEGTFFGKAKQRLYNDDGVSLNRSTQDLWSEKSYKVSDVSTGTDDADADADADANAAANDSVLAGGMYAHLKTPTTQVNNVRTVFVEDDGQFKKFGVSSDGKVTLNNANYGGENVFKDSSLYSAKNIRHLLGFLGFSVSETELNDTDKDRKLAELKLQANSGNKKVMGGVIHSTPSLVSYWAELDATGSVTKNRDEYALFGSMTGALHMVDAKDYQADGTGGSEQFAIITKQMLLNQPEALNGSDIDAIGQPKFGVDAPWLVSATYVYEQEGTGTTAKSYLKVGTQSTMIKKMQTVTEDGEEKQKVIEVPQSAPNQLGGVWAFGGFRLGAKGLYGINLTDKDEPSLAFSLMPSSSDYARIGHIWHKPLLTRIKTNKDDVGTDVLVFGGGYDMCYEDEGFYVGTTSSLDSNCNAKSYADGSAIYIVKAQTGELLWKASSEVNAANSKLTSVSNMKHSIVGEIAIADRNNDGFMDHLYAADLGGQVFRADFTNASNTGGSFSNTRVVRIFHENLSGEASKFTRRFYEKPVVRIYGGESGRFATVSVISGDRSNPLSELRSTIANSDRLYTLFDADVAKANLYNKDVVLGVTDVTPSSLTQLGNPIPANEEARQTQLNAVKDTQNKGWYYPLTRFEGYDRILFNKGVGKMEVLTDTATKESFLYTSIYNPDMSYFNRENSCSAQIKGGSERQFYCMPWGICDTNTGLAGYQRAGIGIQEMAFGPASEGSSKRVMLSSMLVSNHNESHYGENGNRDNMRKVDPSGQVIKVSEDSGASKIDSPDGGRSESEAYQLTPRKWYDVSTTTPASTTSTNP